MDARVYGGRHGNASWTRCVVVVEGRELRCHHASFCRAEGCVENSSLIVCAYLLTAFVALHLTLARAVARCYRSRRAAGCVVAVSDDQDHERDARGDVEPASGDAEEV